MIKGHTKIELTNVKTGQKKVIEDTNMVTNGMSNFMMSNPYNPKPLSLDMRPFSTSVPRSYQLCGGLLLFDKQIEENPEIIFPPEGHKMIGNAVAGISSGNAIPEFGYFDANNSTLEYNGDTTTQKFVFDFGTSQANGQISSVCLASLLAGYMGFGNYSDKRVAENVGNLEFGKNDYNPFQNDNFGHNSKFYFTPFYNSNSGFPFLFDYKKNCVYTSHANAFYHSSEYPNEHFSSGTLKLNKLYCPLSSFNPLQYYDSNSSNNIIVKQSCEVQIPSEILGLNVNILKNRNQVFHAYDGTYLIVGGRNSDYLEQNDTIYVLHVNADLETKLYTLKNTTGERLWNVSASSGSNDRMAVKDGYLYCQRYTSASDIKLRMYRISLIDSTDVTQFPTSYDSTSPIKITLMSDRLWWGTIYILDGVANKMLPVNSNFIRNMNNHYAICGCKFMYVSQSDIISGFYAKCLIEFNPMYLATINNLPEPVVKTSDLTMKITYTLTCTEDGGKQVM